MSEPSKEAVGVAQRFMRWLCVEDNSCKVHAECPRDGWDACGPDDCEAVGLLAEMIDVALAANEVKPGHVVLPVEDVRQAVEALDRAASIFHGLCNGRRLAFPPVVPHRETKAALSTLRKHLEGQSR
jgi:hypothetical protein